MRDYRNIQAWQKADDMTVAVYESSRAFPREEIYGLNGLIKVVEKEANPLQRAAARITSLLLICFSSPLSVVRCQ